MILTILETLVNLGVRFSSQQRNANSDTELEITSKYLSNSELTELVGYGLKYEAGRLIIRVKMETS